MEWLFLSSGLFLGWSLGANDAANIFGTAVGTRMVRFRVAAATCTVFVALGAVFSGAGAAGTLHTLGAVNAPSGSFMAAMAAGMAVYLLLRRFQLPVSSSQAIVGAIVGWCWFSGTLPDYTTLGRIVAGWAISPLLAGLLAAGLYLALRAYLACSPVHMLRVDILTRYGLITAGAFGAYSLGANNIANVMGPFMANSPFQDLSFPVLGVLRDTQQLFLLGSVAVAVGVFTYSRKVMDRLGTGLAQLSPQAALVVVIAVSLVLFLFASQSVESFLHSVGLPALPLIPVSSSQAVIGAIVGISLLKGGREIKFKVLGQIALGWVCAPVLACLFAFLGLFILQNVFQMTVFRPTIHIVNADLLEHLRREGLHDGRLVSLAGKPYRSAAALDADIQRLTGLPAQKRKTIVDAAEEVDLVVNIRQPKAGKYMQDLSPPLRAALVELDGRSFTYAWQLRETLSVPPSGLRPCSALEQQVLNRLISLFQRRGNPDVF